MDAENAISLGALAVAALAIVVGPLMAGRAAQAQHIAERRIDIYAETINLMRARLFEVQAMARVPGLFAEPAYEGPTDEEGEAIAGRVLLVASSRTWTAVEQFFLKYQGTSAARANVAQARREGVPDRAAQAELAQAAREMKTGLDTAIDRMAKDLRTRRKRLALQPTHPASSGRSAARPQRP